MALKQFIYSGLCGLSLLLGAAPALAAPSPGDTVDLRFTGTITDGSQYNDLFGQSLSNNLAVTLDFIVQYNLTSTYNPGSPFSELYGGDPTYPGASPVIGGTVTIDGLPAITLITSSDMWSYLSIDTSIPDFFATWQANSSMDADFNGSGIPADFFDLTPPISGTGSADFAFSAKIGEVTRSFGSTVELDGMSILSMAPEPASWVLFLAAFGGLGCALRLRRSSSVRA
jgi:hypothetical protein